MAYNSFFYDLIVSPLLADAKNWRDIYCYGSSLVTGVWDRYSFRLNPETRVIAIDDADGSGQVSVKLLPKDPGRFMKALRMDETDS